MSKARDIASYGLGVGISSAGVSIASSIRTLDFVGAGNTFTYDAVSNTVDISIAGGGGASAGDSINYPSGTKSPFVLSHARIKENINLDDATTGEDLDSNIIVTESTFTVNAGVALTVGEGKTVIPDLYNVYEKSPRA